MHRPSRRPRISIWIPTTQGFDGDPAAAGLVGTAEQVGDQIEEYRAYTGINNIVCWFNVGGQPPDQVHRSMERFAEKVMPRFQ